MTGSHAIIPVGAVLDKLEELLGADHRPRVAGQRNDWKRTEHSVDCAPLQPELAQVRAR
jgi:hypothetical protein